VPFLSPVSFMSWKNNDKNVLVIKEIKKSFQRVVLVGMKCMIRKTTTIWICSKVFTLIMLEKMSSKQ